MLEACAQCLPPSGPEGEAASSSGQSRPDSAFLPLIMMPGQGPLDSDAQLSWTVAVDALAAVANKFG